jgi:cytochrome P450
MFTAAIWTLVEILRHPEIIPSLRAEITTAISRLSPPTLSSVLLLPQPDLPASLPQLNACFQESLRLYTDTLSLRVVQEDTVLPPSMCGGGTGQDRGLVLKSGEQVVCVTRANAVSPEGDWGESARVWDHKRFLDGGVKGTMNPFGGGVSMCEGKSHLVSKFKADGML